ncbi:spindle and kinetochore-associated protein 2 [Cololabis saira]|uniref:spindle and kinetochore-associated protein 2 n=1 Tax=Cololabis saira TaxID=129043 RepID=UPI002AD272A3|nr:spindle and kinetochore-associated protein 2 [Cololabis saira]
METTVEKLEAMFLKSEADLDFIERRLKLDFINSSAENGCPAKENMAGMLENLKSIKVKHMQLFSEAAAVTSAQTEVMQSIRGNFRSLVDMMADCQQSSDVQAGPVSELEQESAALLGLPITTVEASPAAEAPVQNQPQSCEYAEVTAAMFKALPVSMRSKIKLENLNTLYLQLQQHLSSSSESVSVQKMKQLKMKVSDDKLKVLQQLRLVELDRRGHVHLVV